MPVQLLLSLANHMLLTDPWALETDPQFPNS